ncbi:MULTISPECIES: hypothetical protein [unclassified Streptomyces]|uniref:hypothetical protein n=1 Tax=unclassified Streptomyces TaxID=2593676 RepID=UPI001660B0DE|nr:MULTISPECIES: hypothetical protein [unclassified Streptomyces]MBD0710268.1 hypothetical protein [Streptomyces sp. CBMA291]MBD0712865.1 hypothetical protein [Streptomyces sp. CBMA370]
MSDAPAPTADDPAFLGRLRSVSEELATDLTEELGAPRVLAFLWTTFLRNGDLPTAYFLPLLVRFREESAERTVAALLARIRAETGRTFAVPVSYEPPDEHEPLGRLSAGHEAVWGLDPVDIAVCAAEGVQCLLADRDRFLWPLCPDHRVVPHATRTPGGAAWVCSVTSHVVAPIPD